MEKLAWDRAWDIWDGNCGGETGINDRREMELRVKMIREMNVRVVTGDY